MSNETDEREVFLLLGIEVKRARLGCWTLAWGGRVDERL